MRHRVISPAPAAGASLQSSKASLLNDASALLIYRLAVSAVAANVFSRAVAPTFLFAVAGSIVVGPLLA
jgi:NhaP-type Na+/H+ or K+/H+ antiporter